jgi:hypothetical protein
MTTDSAGHTPIKSLSWQEQFLPEEMGQSNGVWVHEADNPVPLFEVMREPEEAKIKAEAIVLAVNSYSRDKETIKGLLEAAKDLIDGDGWATGRMLDKLKAAISHAEDRQ